MRKTKIICTLGPATKDDEVLKLEIGGIKKGEVEVHAKVSNNGFYEVHLDTDDANAFLITPGDIGVLKK